MVTSSNSCFDLESYIFAIPELWEQDWEASIQESEGVEKSIIIAQARAANLLKTIKDKTVTPDRLAWMSLWTKSFCLLDGAYAAMSRNSLFSLEVLNRIALEVYLHTHVIAEPLMPPESTMQYKETVIDRLCAYTAWTLLEDRELFWEHSKKRNLDMIWSPAPANSIKRNRALLEKYESVHGELELETDPSWLRAERRKQEDQLHKNTNRIDEWLRHPQLREWTRKIAVLAQKTKPKSLSFFAIFNEDDKSIRQRLINLNQGFAYLSYQQASILIHGSSMDQFFHVKNDNLFPKLVATHDEAESIAKIVCSNCTNIILLLALIQRKLPTKTADI